MAKKKAPQLWSPADQPSRARYATVLHMLAPRYPGGGSEPDTLTDRLLCPLACQLLRNLVTDGQ